MGVQGIQGTKRDLAIASDRLGVDGVVADDGEDAGLQIVCCQHFRRVRDPCKHRRSQVQGAPAIKINVAKVQLQAKRAADGRVIDDVRCNVP